MALYTADNTVATVNELREALREAIASCRSMRPTVPVVLKVTAYADSADKLEYDLEDFLLKGRRVNQWYGFHFSSGGRLV